MFQAYVLEVVYVLHYVVQISGSLRPSDNHFYLSNIDYKL